MAGEWVAVDVRLIEALVAAERARRETAGLFDATMLPALLAAGYDRSFELLDGASRRPRSTAGRGRSRSTSTRPAHARVEAAPRSTSAGIGKGFAATRALAALRAAWPGASGALIDLGGDIALVGSPAGGRHLAVDIADPRAPAPRRNARSHGRRSRHVRARHAPLRTRPQAAPPDRSANRRVPADDGPLAVTVVAASATEAEAHATALAIADAEGCSRALAERPDLAALLIPHTGDPVVLGRLPLIAERAAVRVVVTPHSGRTP